MNYRIVAKNLLKNLPIRTRDILERRFGLEINQKETLESIGKSYGITRERVRQIEQNGLRKIQDLAENQLRSIFKNLTFYLKKQGNLKKEDLFLADFGGSQFKNQVYFFLTLGKEFHRFNETEDFYSFWTIDFDSVDIAHNLINSFIRKLKEKKQPLDLKEALKLSPNLKPIQVASYLEISKEIVRGPEKLYGLKDWPEVNPRSVKDKAFLVLKKEARPLHFTEILPLINKLNLPSSGKTSQSVQTVHNELIKDPRFVLVGRGIYALREWGYTPGRVREVIFKILKESKRPLTKEEVLEKVLAQRLVKKNTVLLNLQNKQYFLKDSRGRYIIREA